MNEMRMENHPVILTYQSACARADCFWSKSSPGSATASPGAIFYRLLRRLVEWSLSVDGASFEISFRSLQWRQHGNEIGGKTSTVIIQQLTHSLMTLRPYNQSGVMFLLNPIDNLRVIIRGGIGKFLSSERKNDSGVVSSWLQFRPRT